MNFIIENNKFDKRWYKIEAYTVPESDEIRTKLGACLFLVENNQNSNISAFITRG